MDADLLVSGMVGVVRLAVDAQHARRLKKLAFDGPWGRIARGGPSIMKDMKLGGGGRFQALKESLAKKGASSPGALAAAIGRRKYGSKKMADMAQKGKS